MAWVSGLLTACLWCGGGPLVLVWERLDRYERIVVGEVVCQACYEVSLFSRRPTSQERTHLAHDADWEQPSLPLADDASS